MPAAAGAKPVSGAAVDTLTPGSFAKETLAAQPLTEDSVKNTILGHTWNADDVIALAAQQGWSLEELEKNIVAQDVQRADTSSAAVYALRVRASLFGHNAPNWDTLIPELQKLYGADWEGRTIAGDIAAKRGEAAEIAQRLKKPSRSTVKVSAPWSSCAGTNFPSIETGRPGSPTPIGLRRAFRMDGTSTSTARNYVRA